MDHVTDPATTDRAATASGPAPTVTGSPTRTATDASTTAAATTGSATTSTGFLASGSPLTGSADAVGVARAPRRWWHRRPWLVELVLALCFALTQAVGSLLSLIATEGSSLLLDWAGFQVGLAAVLVRRLHPRLTLGVGLVGTLVLIPLTGGDLLFVVAVALYTLAVHRSATAAWRGLAVSAAGLATVTGLGALGLLETSGLLTVAPDPTTQGPVYDLGAGALLVLGLVVVTLVGTNVGARRRYVQSLVDRARDLERERDQRARLAVAEERSRIAREMHDVVAHSLSIMVALSDGASETVDVDRVRAASAQAAETGREALVEMRQALRVLDPDDTGERRPTPGLGDLPALVAELRAVGLPVAATYEPGLELPPTLGLTVYRLVQESLTNVLRHSRQPRRVRVLVVAVGRHLEVEVTDDGTGPTSSGGPAVGGAAVGGAGAGATAVGGSGGGGVDGGRVGPGRGLLGMRERVAAVGGVLEVGPRDGGGWRVRALIPLPEPHRDPVTAAAGVGS
ncbi:sensor histidine kinase [Auraticoccus monumenti]|uniref:histidine kinase n=1 Tax=Auraticoccus monumenti TaxID=675864 RepID=A0A1G6SZT0_9ACTN|nr:histidine kinase [Auraticoccus monumenti]SDD22298.1 Signal transduction histidine kinase [Auraticoccus monumenti]